MSSPQPTPGRTASDWGRWGSHHVPWHRWALLLVAILVGVGCSDDPVSEDPPPEPVEVDVSLEGTVTDTTGESVDGAAVAVYEEDGSEALDQDSTSADGTYVLSLTVQAPGALDSLRLVADADGYEPQEARVPLDVEEEASVTLERDLRLTPREAGPTEATAAGTVTENESGDPIEGATVTGTRPGGEVLFETTTGASGTYEATFTVGDAPGEVALSATADGYGSSETTVPFAEEMTADLALTVATTTASASGTITNAETGDPFADATVTGTRAESGGILFETSTDANGDYDTSFDVADPPQEVTIAATADGLEREATTVPFSDEMTADLSLAPATTEATATGTVTEDGTGDPIQGATVTGARAGSGEMLFETSTDANGDYEATYEVADPPAEVTVTAGADGFKETTETVPYEDDLTVDLALSPQTYEQVVTGTVTDDLGDVVEDGDVVVTSSDGDTICDVTTQAFMGGECVDTGTVGSEPDSYTVDVGRVHLQDQAVTVPFAEAENADVELPREFYQITGSVVNEANQAVSGQDVEITFQDSMLASTSSDPDGQHSSEVTFYEVTDVENPEGDVAYPESDFYKQASVGFTAQDPSTTIDVGETTLPDKIINATFQGSVFDQGTGEGVSDVSVEYMTDEGQSRATTTDNLGDFSGQLEIPKRNEPSTINLIVNEGEKQGYESKTVQEAFVENLNRDVGLEPLLQEVTFTLEPYDVRGNAVNDLTVSVKSPNRDVQTFPVQNGEIDVSYEVENVQEALKIWHDFGNNNKYNDVLMIREQNQGVPPIAEDNIANNNMQEGWSHCEPFDTLSVEASQLDGKQNLDAYLAEYSHETNVGQVNVNDSDAVELAFGRTDNLVYGYDEVNGIDSLRVLLFEYNVDDPDEDIDPEVINEQEDYLNQILTNLTQHPKVLDYKIDRISDPSELDPYENENFENTLRVYNRNLANPSNGMGLEGNRFSTPSLNLPETGSPKSTFIEEVIEATAGMVDPVGGDTKGYTLKDEDDPELNSFGETVYNLNLLLNKETEIE